MRVNTSDGKMFDLTPSFYAQSQFLLNCMSFDSFDSCDSCDSCDSVTVPQVPITSDTMSDLLELCTVVGSRVPSQPVRHVSQLLCQIPGLRVIPLEQCVDMIKGAHFLNIESCLRVLSVYMACHLLNAY